jgi:hypothetical protein
MKIPGIEMGRRGTGGSVGILRFSQPEFSLLGVNWGPGVDTFERNPYIQRPSNEHLVGTPLSRGCICMENADVSSPFADTREGTFVLID